jgi:cobalt-zinc-cadmium efflux system protein
MADPHHKHHDHADHDHSGHDHAGHDHRGHEPAQGHKKDHGHAHHGHDHGHGHSNAPADFGVAFAVGAGLNVGFVAIEAAAGIFTGSLALLADAGHNLADVLGLLLAWTAVILARQPATQRRTYGLRKATILASLANAGVLLAGVGAVAWEALIRLDHSRPVQTGWMAAVATVGVVINTVTALMFMRGRKDDISLRGVYLHMAADAAVSAGVVVAALAIGVTGWLWLDPTVTLVVLAVIMLGTWGLLRESLDMALDAAPRGIDPAKVRQTLGALPGVINVHHIHIWAMSTTETALTAHLLAPGFGGSLLQQAATALKTEYGIGHVTLQIEDEAANCDGPCAELA